MTTVPDPDYRVTVQVGAHSWEASFGDAPDYGVALPLTFGWQVPEGVDFFPAQADPSTGSFGLVVASVEEVTDLALLDPVTIDVYVPAAAATPWQHVEAVVSQVDASVGAGAAGTLNLLTVYFTDPLLLLAHEVVGLVDWPQEVVSDRVDRICAEAGITTDWVDNQSSVGILAARDADPTDVFSELRAALRDDADRNTSYPGTVLYGRIVYSYTPATRTLHLRVWDREPFTWPAYLAGDGTIHRRTMDPDTSDDVAPAAGLDGCAAETGGAWTRLPQDLPTYVIVDGVPFGDPAAADAIPYVRSTSYVDDFTAPGGNTSADARVILGRSLLPVERDPTAWRTDVIRHDTYLDPGPVTGWFGADPAFVGEDGSYVTMPWAAGGIRNVIVAPVEERLTLDGRTWIEGTLAGATWTLPPGGRHYTEVTLRPGLFETDPKRIVPS